MKLLDFFKDLFGKEAYLAHLEAIRGLEGVVSTPPASIGAFSFSLSSYWRGGLRQAVLERWYA